MKKLILLLCLAGSALVSAAAAISQPDNLVYGTIVLDGHPVADTDSTIHVEARRTLAGPPLASYQMGANSDAGQFLYLLQLGREAFPSPQSSALQAGENVFIVVVDDSGGIRASQIIPVPEWGEVTRLDFGPALDTDHDGIPESWEEFYFGATLPNSADADGDGQSDGAEYIAGTQPNSANSVFKISVAVEGEELNVSFQALLASGIGYNGRTRFYTLESSSSLLPDSWQIVTNYSRILGANQTVLYTQPLDNQPPIFYRARITLEGP